MSSIFPFSLENGRCVYWAMPNLWHFVLWSESDGDEHGNNSGSAYLYDVPEPSTGLLMTLALLGFAPPV